MGSVAYHEPRTVGEVAALLSRGRARCLAGGQILIAEMNAGFPPPEVLISLGRVDELRDIERRPDGAMNVGAMVTHRTILRSDLFHNSHDLLRAAAFHIASPAIQSVATIGGSICRGDPRLDYPAVLLALDAVIHVRSVEGTRAIETREFFVDSCQTALRPNEFVTHVEFRPVHIASIGLYDRVSRTSHDLATVSVALAVRIENGICSEIALALGSCGPTPIRSREAEERLLGSHLDADDVAEACELMLIPRVVQRVIARAART
jgi:aerobic carbon-monoxide dehydrogenase medium subunit